MGPIAQCAQCQLVALAGLLIRFTPYNFAFPLGIAGALISRTWHYGTVPFIWPVLIRATVTEEASGTLPCRAHPVLSGRQSSVSIN